MKKKYEGPNFELVVFDDVITTSIMNIFVTDEDMNLPEV